MESSVKMLIQFNKQQLTLPINPEELQVSREADNEDINIVGLGKATRKGEPGLRTCTISSFFPNKNSYFYTNVKPKTCVNFINKIWKTDNKNNNVAKIVTTGLPKNLVMYFVVNNFSYNNKAGEEQDIYYELEIKEYVPYGVKLVQTKKKGIKTTRAKSTAVKKVDKQKQKEKKKENRQTQVNKTYKVVRGDCLWNITKKYTGKGSRWRELYNLNKDKIKNPNLIYPNQILTLPLGW